MKLPYKVLSGAFVATIATASIVAPTPSSAAAGVLDEVVVKTSTDQNISISLTEYATAVFTQKGNVHNLIQGGTIVAVASEGKYLPLTAYATAVYTYDNDITKAIEETASVPNDVLSTYDELEGFNQDGTPILKDIEVPADLEVIEISSINKTGVTVSFPSLGTAGADATVEVKNPAGEPVAVVAQDIAPDQTEATFTFAKPLEEVVAGKWTVDGKDYVATGPSVGGVSISGTANGQNQTINADVVTNEDGTGTITFSGIVPDGSYTTGTADLSEAGFAALGDISIPVRPSDDFVRKLSVLLDLNEDGAVRGSTLLAAFGSEEGQALTFTDANGTKTVYTVKAIADEAPVVEEVSISGEGVQTINADVVTNENGTGMITFSGVVAAGAYTTGTAALSETATVSIASLPNSSETVQPDDDFVAKLAALLDQNQDGQVLGSTLIQLFGDVDGETLTFTDAAGNETAYTVKVTAAE